MLPICWALFYILQWIRQMKSSFYTKLKFSLVKKDSKETHNYIICQVGGLRRPGSSRQKFQRREEASPEEFLGRGSRKCKGTETTVCLACWRVSKSNRTGLDWARDRMLENEIMWVSRGWNGGLLMVYNTEITGFVFECVGKSSEVFEARSKRGVIYSVKSDIKSTP